MRLLILILMLSVSPFLHSEKFYSDDKNASLTIAKTSPSASPAKTSAPDAQDLYEGIVINQTITRPGQDFYHYFVATWREQ